MAIHWRLRSYIASQRGLLKPVQLQKRVLNKTGVLISLQNICNYLNKNPSSLNLKTMEILCTALDCELKDFFEVAPSKKLLESKGDEIKKLSWKNTPVNKRAQKNFPDPKDYK